MTRLSETIVDGQADHLADHEKLAVKANDEFDVRDFGAVGDGVADDTAALDACSDAAHSAGWGVMFLPPGTWTTDGLALSGKGINIVGSGMASTLQGNDGIAGAVLDFTSWSSPSNMVGKAIFRDFQIRGDGQSDATATRYGMDTTGAHSVAMSNISIADTGGPGWYSADVYLSTFSGIVVERPIDAGTNDVPYIYFRGAMNGDLFSAIGLRSVTSDPDGSAAWLIEDGGVYITGQSTWQGCWSEYQHPPEGGAILDWVVNSSRIEIPQFFDFSTAVDTTDTAFIRMREPVNGATTYGGGNYLWGLMPGGDSRTYGGSAIAVGIDMLASRNSINGAQGYYDQNVRLGVGVGYSAVHLLGRFSGVDLRDSVVDNSGLSTNTIIDQSGGIVRVNGLGRLSGAGTPEGSVVGSVGWTYQRTDGGADTTFYVKESGTGNTGWVAK